jgi:hypothetical protein
MKTPVPVLILVGVGLVAAGCANHSAEEAFQLSPRSPAERRIESRRFEGTDQTKLLIACQALLQDMGFHTDESESKLGLLVASADREAGSTGEVIGSLLWSNMPVLNVLQPLFGKKPNTWDDRQKVRASVVVSEVGSGSSGTYIVRVTFQRIVWDNHERLSKQEWLGQPELYQDFFSRLSKSIFLKANEI